MKPGIPKGTRDFLPQQVMRRNYIFDTIQQVFVKYGFQPIETPTMENLSTLTGKYGEEGDRLLFKVLNNGDFLRKADKKALETLDSNALISSISKRGMRYDLTVPFARFVVMYQHELTFPFKRYQIQPVWRADRPQKGRYQEFYQCDVDVIGSDSLMYEAELVQIYDEVFHNLRIPVQIRLNNRKILAGMAEAAGIPDQFMDMTIAIDKLDKIGTDGVEKEMVNRNIPANAAKQIIRWISDNDLEAIEQALSTSESGRKGIKEIQEVQAYLSDSHLQNEYLVDLTLARGLNYYTGCIFEVNGLDIAMGSLGGGGRYDDLTGIFGLKDMSGVGVSFGAERIYDVMESQDLFPDHTGDDLQLVLVAFDPESHQYAFRCLNQLRDAGIHSELYPEPTKLKKQMKYADARNAPYVALIGSEEIKAGKLSVKDMASGEQEKLSLEKLISKLQMESTKN